jgi:Trk K+ transport system NAD-binding subunit
MKNPREYTVEMVVTEKGSIAGKTLKQSGLTASNQMYLVEINRDGEILPAVEPNMKLNAGDRLVFSGLVDAMQELQKISADARLK